MKKVILSAAALFCGAIMFGQVSGAPEATSQTTVDNNSVSTANKGKSVQEGTDHRVRVRQAGTKQSVYTYQANGSGTIGANKAEVLQSGDVTLNSGVLNEADVFQYGDENKSKIIQEGDKNNAITNQGVSDPSSARNQAFIRQGNNGNAEKNYAAIDQDGSDNQAKTIQTYDNNDAYTDQDGTNHKSRIRQIANPDGSMGHWALVDQDGDGQESWVKQEGAGARNYAYTAQAGNNNYADQYQTTAATTGNANRAQIAQGINGAFTTTGFNNEIINLRDNTLGVLGYPLNVSLYSRDAQAFQDQNGDDNQAYIGQFGELGGTPPVGNYAEQDQTGDDNNAFIVQNFYGATPAGGNKAQQDQVGDRNDAGIHQLGSAHKASQYQMGNDNTALAAQRGQGNKSFTFQYGDDNWVSTAQRGMMNKAVVSQYDGQSYIVEQNVIDGMPNGNNQVDVIQMGPDGAHFEDVAANCLIEMDEPQDWTPTPGPSTPDICVDCP